MEINLPLARGGLAFLRRSSAQATGFDPGMRRDGTAKFFACEPEERTGGFCVSIGPLWFEWWPVDGEARARAWRDARDGLSKAWGRR